MAHDIAVKLPRVPCRSARLTFESGKHWYGGGYRAGSGAEELEAAAGDAVVTAAKLPKATGVSVEEIARLYSGCHDISSTDGTCRLTREDIPKLRGGRYEEDAIASRPCVRAWVTFGWFRF